MLKRDRGVCQIRGPRCIVRAVEVDHVLAGDNHDMTNLRAVCTRCHASKSAQEGAAARKAQGKYNDRRQREQHPGFIQ